MSRQVYVGVENFTPVTLPEGYTQVEYIESDGTQYIDTGFKPTQDSYVKVRFYSETPGNCILGCDTDWGVDGFCIGSGYSEYADTVTNTGQNFSISANTMYDVEMTNEGKLYVNGTLVWTATKTNFTASNSLTLFGLNRNGTVREYSSVRIYSFEIGNNGVAERNFVACTDVTGVSGFYDIVNNVFYDTAGNGNLVSGTEFTYVARKVNGMYVGVETFEPVVLPDDYTQVEYIESSGTQYINTGFNPNNNTKIEITYQTTAIQSGIIAADDNWESNGFGIWANASEYGNATLTNVSFYGNNVITMTLDKGKLYNGPSLVWTAEEATFQTSSPLTIFALNRGGNIVEYITSCKLYRCKIWDNDSLVRDYIPSVNVNGLVGLYDIVTNVFYENAGTGVFTTSQTTYKCVSRRVKKGYVSIGGIARPFFGDYGLEYYGQITNLINSVSHPAATTVGDYALFAGGFYNDDDDMLATVTTYNTSLTRGSATDLSVARAYMGATTVNGYALFAGGLAGAKTTVDAYDASLTRTIPTVLSVARGDIGSETIGNHALFVGGQKSYSSISNVQKTVDTYDGSLTHSTLEDLSYNACCMATATVGEYALFAGGFYSSGSYGRQYVYAYNKSLTRSMATELPAKIGQMGGATAGEHALFAGGSTASGMGSHRDTVYAYSVSLTRSNVTPLSVSRQYPLGVSLGEFALFGGGYYSGAGSNVVDVYDKSLTRTNPTGLANSTRGMGATSVGKYALFGGGEHVSFFNAVTAYKLI